MGKKKKKKDQFKRLQTYHMILKVTYTPAEGESRKVPRNPYPSMSVFNIK